MSSGTGSFLLTVAGTAASVIPGLGWALRAGIILVSSIGSEVLKRRGLAGRQEGLSRNVTSNEASVPVIYGRAKVGMAITDVRPDTATPDNEDLALVGVLGVASENGGGIEAVEKIWFDERLAIDGPTFGAEPNQTGLQDPWDVGHVKYGLHAGADGQLVDAELDSRFSDYGTHTRFRGLAYLALILKFDKDVFPTGIPNVTALVKGQKVYDPRTSTWGWSSNPALCVLDYLTSQRYGLGASYAERDGGSASEVDEQSFIDAANHCDELVSTPAGDQPRFTCHGALDTGRSIEEGLADLLSACRGDLIYESGKFRLVIRQVTTPTSFELTEDNIVGDWEWIRGGLDETANRVSATFVDAENEYQPNDVTWPEADQANTFLGNDGDFENVLEIELPFTTDYYEAQQHGMVALREMRADLGIAVTAKEEALALRVGDVVPLTHSTPGWTQKDFWVHAMGLNPAGQVRLVLREYDGNAYSLDVQNTRDTLPGSNLPDARTVPAPTGVAAVSNTTTARRGLDGQLHPRIKLTWTKPADYPFLDHYQVLFRKTGSTPWLEAPNVDRGETETHIEGVEHDVAYDVRLFAVGALGNRSAAVDVQVTASEEAWNTISGTARWIPLDTAGNSWHAELALEVESGVRSIQVESYLPAGLAGDPPLLGVSYSVDLSEDTAHRVEDGQGATQVYNPDIFGRNWWWEVTPYDAVGGAGGAGAAGRTRKLTPVPMEETGEVGGRFIRNAASETISGRDIKLRPFLDASLDNGVPRIEMRGIHNAGTLSGSFTHDYANGDAVEIAMNGDLTLHVPSGMLPNEQVFFRLVTNGNTLSFGPGWEFPGGAPSPTGVVIISAMKWSSVLAGFVASEMGA